MALTGPEIIGLIIACGLIALGLIQIRKRKPSTNIIKLKDAVEEDWDKCKGLNHVPTTFQYGAHPNRVYQFCPFCHIKSRLEWKDTSARISNRLWVTVPLIIQGTLIIVVIAFAVYAAIFLGGGR